ncbi:PREDICTED: uncharacterized protein LOC109462066 [Branchiostoma belcheri]|uniref:Uncharacterized protein LOC109462066 n=1 Tax=Branchiostoma belcheri TaxID=7741 RepID=A0A6P4XPW8_BRABE|nr:PREDICTED: uncharacterized protein LOC109462066 [Branchiostoma belcheri]
MALGEKLLVLATLLTAGARADHLSDFFLRHHRSISGHNVKTYCGVDPEYCARHCKIDSGYNCRSFDYNTGSRCCYMNDESSATAPTNYVRTIGTDYYEIKAGRALDLYTFTADRRLQGVANIIKCGMRAEDCAQWCMKEKSFTCMSFDYDKEFTCCYLSEETRHTMSANNFVSSSSHDYYEFRSGAATGYFDVAHGHSLTNNNDLILCEIEPEGCALRCLQETGFQCKSFDYATSWRCCYLSAQDKTTQSSNYQVTGGQDYYQYLPGNRWRDDGRCGSSWSADLASPAECDPYGEYCCSGSRCQQGTCTSGTDYRGWSRCGERMCSCNTHTRTMTCSGRTVREIDFFIPRNTRNLDLSGNMLTSVSVSALARLTELQTLNLRANRISSLPFDVFEDLSSVQTINLQSNQFNELDLGQFMDLPALRNLYMDSGTNLKFSWGYLPEVYPNHGVSCPFNDCYSPCGDPHYLNGPQDWSRLQTDLVIKKLYFDLADLFYLVSDVTRSVTIYAHTVVASVGVSFDFDLTIHTQMFWTNTDADLTFKLPSGHHTGPMITCGDLDDSFRQININVGNKLKINIVTNESFAMPYPCSDRRSTALALQADSDQMAITVQCARLLAQDFNLGDLRSQPMRMVDWVISQGRAAGDPVQSEAVTIKYELMVSARGARYVPYLSKSVYVMMLDDYYREVRVCLFVCLFYELMVSARGARYVPYLSKSVYVMMLDDYYREANVFRDEYNRALDRTESVDIRLEAARRLLAKQNDIIQLQEHDLQDMETELNVAKETRRQMKARLDESNTELDQAKIDFERGIEQYQEQQAAQAAFGFIGAVFGIFIGVIQIGLGDVAGGVNSIVGSTIDIADTITAIGLGDVAGGVSSIADLTMYHPH